MGAEGHDGRDPGSPLERALVSLITASTHLVPEAIGEAVHDAGRHLGGRSTAVLLVDLEQVALRPIGRGEGPLWTTQPVDGSAAGEAFRSESPVTEATGGGTVLWVPILDSADRLGVVGTIVDDATPEAQHAWAMVASFVGELVVTKSRYGDGLSAIRRNHPVTLAGELRWAMLPPLTFTSPDVVLTGVVEPAYEVAGDTFDYAVGSTVAHLALFDAMGHDLAASRMANEAVGVYRASRRRGDDLRGTVRSIDETIREQFGDFRFVTGQVATLDLVTGVLELVNAGHPPCVLYHRDGTHEEVTGARTVPLGLGADPPRPTRTPLRDGDVVLFHTDGATEARTTSGGFVGDDEVRRTVGRHLAAGLRPAEVLRRTVVDLLRGGPSLRDDATLLLLAWRPGPRALPPAVRPG
jgi:hypothetical protein